MCARTESLALKLLGVERPIHHLPLIMSTPKSQAPLAMNDGEKIIDGDGTATQWAASAIASPIEFAISRLGELSCRGDFA